MLCAENDVVREGSGRYFDCRAGRERSRHSIARVLWAASCGLLRAMLALLVTVTVLPEVTAATPAPENGQVYFIWPTDGTVIKGGKFWVRMGLRNMGVAPKGVAQPNVGHHHILIDTDLPPMDEPIPSDRNHLHFGAGETEARIELPPGRHTLQLLLGDDNHIPHQPPVYSKKISITVR
jgi:hypothetical protein